LVKGPCKIKFAGNGRYWKLTPQVVERLLRRDGLWTDMRTLTNTEAQSKHIISLDIPSAVNREDVAPAKVVWQRRLLSGGCRIDLDA
jgi:hypothetical protein